MIRRAWSLLCLAAILCLGLAGCGGLQTYSQVFYDKCDTDVSITLYLSGDATRASELFRGCEELLDRAEKIFSRTDPEAELAAVNADPSESVLLSEELSDLLGRAIAGAVETGGCFDPTLGALSDLFDIGGDAPLPDAAQVAVARERTGYTKLRLEGRLLCRTRPDIVLDLGAIAKGYLAAALVTYLEGEGVSGGVLSLGGNVAVFGEKPGGTAFRVAVRSPFEDGAGYAGILEVEGGEYISTSGAYERYRIGPDGTVYHHILDGRTGYPAWGDLASVTVIGRDGARADMLSTALFVMGREDAIAFYEAGAQDYGLVLIAEDGGIWTSPGVTWERL